MSSFASSSSNPECTFEYDVFLTISHPKHNVKTCLEKYFRDVGIKPLIDDQMEEFLVHDIVKCRMIVVVFTPQFLESDMFLKRIVTIRKCQKLAQIKVSPVFCGLSEEQVREQLERVDQRRLDSWDLDMESGGFVAEAASLLDSATAIAEAASLSDLGDKISNLIAKLNKSLFHEELFHDLQQHQAGLQRHLKELLDILRQAHLTSEDTFIVGIWGDGGIGKTTIAKTFYDKIGSNFEGKSFLANIKDVWDNRNGRVLKKQLISDISEVEIDEKKDVLVIHEQMMKVLHGKRVLVVLDNVNSGYQLMELCGNMRWFGRGSLIFITARNKDVFKNFVDVSYEMKRLDSDESIKLFNWHAFKRATPKDDFEDLSNKVVTFCEGLPLLLEVIGSILHNRTLPECQGVLLELDQIPYGQMQRKLYVGIEFLTDLEKDLFFNIASFYVGQSKTYVTKLLKDLRFPVEVGMPVLFERNLVKVIDDNLYVHDLFQEIVRSGPDKPKLKYSYDVFLSFRGEDTRKSFATHLYSALKQAGIDIYMDEERIERGEGISSSLLQAIESSKISIIILSKNYAGSSWCLQELKKIMECYKTTYQEVLPIFFDVRPSEVRKQTNSFGKAWERLVKRTLGNEVENWKSNSKRALIEVANLSGWDMHNYRTETELIDEVIETITKKLGDNKSLFVARHPVGLKSRMQAILQLLRSKTKDVIIAGIWGMGGIGKTTIAKAIYNQVGQSFEGKCFLANVREVWKQDNGQVYLQEQLLSDIFKSRRRALPNVEMGKTLLEEMLCKKKVLVVLDDVNNEDQLKALCGSREWFGQGSRIIITTRDERLLKILKVIHVYTMKELDDNESLELFSWHAFKQATPEQDFIEISRRVVFYSGGLPLALEILGSHLFDREIEFWEDVLKKLQQIPDGQIHEKLKISYDGLSDNTEKDVFLDICCFLVGKDRSYAVEILNGCRLHAEIGISRLIELSLVKVGNKNKLEMHDLLRDMGREIIRAVAPDEPENRTRLWYRDDVLDVLRESTGTKAIKGLALNMPKNDSVSCSAKAFKEMKRLCLLQLSHVQLDGDYNYLSTELRWLCWHGFTRENMPMNLCLQKIVAVDLKWSNLIKVWENCQLLEKLKILNLSHSHYLIETPKFSKLPYLEKLVLKDCSRLSTIHPSIGNLKYIILLNLKDCKSLKRLPRSVYNLISLKTLNICGCSKIEKLGEDIGKMDSLTTLVANQTAITQVPFSLVRLKSIKCVSLCGYEGSSRDVFPSLVLSWMSPSHRSRSLSRAFQILPSLTRGISHLFARSNDSFEPRQSTAQALCQKAPTLIEFHAQVPIKSLETFISSLTIRVSGFNRVVDTLLKSISQGCNDDGLDFSLPMDNYPDWLVFVNEGSSVSFKVPQIVGRCLKGVVLHIIYLPLQDSMSSVYPIGVMIKNFTKTTIDFYKRDAGTGTTSADEEWQKITSNLEPGDDVKVKVEFAHKYSMKKTAIYLIYVEETNELSITELS
ncbi:uncharacterized protein LOC114711083 [Neltuma alba]|uniref:uncharacterized protein LOC114711083 n=1 Tax=Neltuma alba TaxID=207710 RepID=UPI0010A2B33E|nr:uncharacterized protein LOC114711083 [Prosopis alba]XP_028751267.1 uncharacterized protein LOC114711083 [Prosopis alba]XP_028751268.1 uncharacterized protein LOC114711083 [Prosopis alba]XP_028751269.1 uncharacterized protein LOC114711083 [Prosopis alba]XP_028751270.1 uncharacterized protein LOC114711083 [Prosopis alba]XP_028751271.1 uncharacterized protein LOC114711083 [Prosopis alba]